MYKFYAICIYYVASVRRLMIFAFQSLMFLTMGSYLIALSWIHINLKHEVLTCSEDFARIPIRYQGICKGKK